MKCLFCGEPAIHVKYMTIPGHIIVPNAYDLCDEHRHISLGYYDIYDKDAKRHPDIKAQLDLILKRESMLETPSGARTHGNTR